MAIISIDLNYIVNRRERKSYQNMSLLLIECMECGMLIKYFSVWFDFDLNISLNFDLCNLLCVEIHFEFSKQQNATFTRLLAVFYTIQTFSSVFRLNYLSYIEFAS